MTSANEMSIAPKIQPVCSWPGILLYLESSRPGPGVGVTFGVVIDVDVGVDAGVDVVDVVLCRFYKREHVGPALTHYIGSLLKLPRTPCCTLGIPSSIRDTAATCDDENASKEHAQGIK